MIVVAESLPRDPLTALRVLTESEHELDRIRRTQVIAARAAGASWQQIGDALGVSRQSAWESFTAETRAALASNVDPNDDYLIALARANDAEVIISGDKDLLDWELQQPPVVTPAQFEQGVSAT